MAITKTRFAPSPTGKLHLGGLRTALYAWCFAKKSGGEFYLRIEDTDQKRFVKGAKESLISVLKRVGLDFKDKPIVQSQRKDIYQKHANQLIEKDVAYRCFCTKETLKEMKDAQREQKKPIKYDARCRTLSQKQIDKNLQDGLHFVVRLAVPKDRIFLINDIIYGETKIHSSLVDDQVLIKSDGFPTYHLAATVDDHLMGITHVIRGQEWLSSTPKHILLYEYFGWKAPVWAHLPLILNRDKSKLSKRHGDFSVEQFIELGYLPQTLVNFVALLGWHPQGDNEIFNLQQMASGFSLADVNKSGAVFDQVKLDWMNAHYLKTMDLEKLTQLSKPFFVKAGFDVSEKNKLLKVVQFARERITLLPQIVDISRVFYEEINFTCEDLQLLKDKNSQKVFAYYLQNLKPDFKASKLEELILEASKACGVKGKDYYFPLRLALYGQTKGPHIPVLIEILGYEKTRARLAAARN